MSTDTPAAVPIEQILPQAAGPVGPYSDLSRCTLTGALEVELVAADHYQYLRGRTIGDGRHDLEITYTDPVLADQLAADMHRVVGKEITFTAYDRNHNRHQPTRARVSQVDRYDVPAPNVFAIRVILAEELSK